MKVLLIGCGNIGKAMLDIWSGDNAIKEIAVIKKSVSNIKLHYEDEHINFYEHLSDLPHEFKPDICVLAIKPQNLNDIIDDIKLISDEVLIVSTLAGTSIKQLSTKFTNCIVRLMPNIAIKYGHSTNLTFADNLNEFNKNKVIQCFYKTGGIIWVEKEEDLDVLTPISGSGPAYFYLMAQILIEEALKLGISEDIARKIVYKTFIGSTSLVYEGSDYKQLIETVASKGGVTESALSVMESEMKQVIATSIKVALKRVEELLKI